MSTDVLHDINRTSKASGAFGEWTWSLQDAAYATQQHLMPIHPNSMSRHNSDASHQSGEQTPRAENTLRRKTPNGTLNAGYDASLERVNPPKRQLMPIGGIPPTGYLAPSSNVVKRAFLQHYQLHDAAQAPQISTSFPVMDSMLHQMPTQAYHGQTYFGQTIPSVRQPSFQYVGPTASAVQGSGPYGPYWHDGTFVPYRPAAVRDPRFYQNNMLQQNAPQHAPSAQAQGFYNFASQSMYSGLSSPLHGISAFGDPIPPVNQQLPYITNTNGPLRYGPQDVSNHLAWESASSVSGQAVKEEFGPSSPNGKQRDRAFDWALQQYRDLLAFIHHSRKQQQQTRLVQGQPQVPHRPSFYPKPPKSSLSGSSVHSRNFKLGAETHTRLQGRDGPPPLQRADTAPSVPQSRGRDPEAGMHRNRPSSLWSPSGAHLQDGGFQRRVSYEPNAVPQTEWPDSIRHEGDKFKPIRRSSGSSGSPHFPPLPADHSPPSRAARALSSMTDLCRETDWRWTDGMHLGGCLAYGLGQYERALKWFKKVLEMDPKHLEATSNLAATLLALNQRQEAEKHWMKVVMAAPNHFEAVEHLVGMLCNDQRSRDAVQVIEHMERCLAQPRAVGPLKRPGDHYSESSSSNASRSPCVSEPSDKMAYDFENDGSECGPDWKETLGSNEPDFGSSGFAIPGCDNGRILALIHAKGNMLYALGDNAGAARAFEEAVLIAAGREFDGIQGLVKHILSVVSSSLQQRLPHQTPKSLLPSEPILLTPDQALITARLCFPSTGELPGLRFLPGGPYSIARKAVISTTSNSLLSLAKIFQDGMSNTTRAVGITPLASGVRDILALYYLSLSLQPSPSTANNVGILLAGVQQIAVSAPTQQKPDIPGVVPGSGIALALQYYNYGLQLDQSHAHLYTNLGSLLKDIGQLDAAINMYERAVKCDAKFDIALANLANAVKDKGRINDAIHYYKRAVDVSPDFAEAVCGLANALNSVCAWNSRGGIAADDGKRDRWHVDGKGMLLDARQPGAKSSGWIKRVVEIVEKQLADGEGWGRGVINPTMLEHLVQQLAILHTTAENVKDCEASLRKTLTQWMGHKWEGARLTRLLERAAKRIGWLWYHDLYIKKKQRRLSTYNRPQLPSALAIPTAPTVLPFHTFTCPMSAQQIRLISQRNGLRISASTLRSPWLSKQVYPPPRPPAPHIRVGYISSDFNNHPLAHLMQSVFGMHDRERVMAHCYATTASDNSIHRQQIQSEAPVFYDASNWSAERLVNQIVKDNIHILVNLNGYTRGARNEVFAARPAPIQMSFMGFAGTLGAEWCDFLLADETAVPPSTLRPWRRNVDVEDQLVDENNGGDNDEWIYSENIIYCRDTFFCCDHRQSAPDARDKRLSWNEEQEKRWQMRKELFPQISDDTIIFGNFNQLYKIEPTTFRTWLRILATVSNSILWLLRFPDLGESHLLATARLWAGAEVASRVVFTDVAPKHLHISRARICDLVLDTAECNAHTTAADVLWSGTPLLTLPRYQYKMCSRMAASILKGALPKTDEGAVAAKELIADDEDDYEAKAVALGKGLGYSPGSNGVAQGRLMELRSMLFHARWSSALFDTKRWVRDLEDAYEEAWRRWVAVEGGDIWLAKMARRAE